MLSPVEHRFSLYASLLVTCPDCSHPCSFFAEAQRITADDYVPSIEDIGRVPENPVKGVTEAHFKIHGLSIRVLQVYSQQSYRRKWIEPFLDASVIFFTSLSDYNEPGISRMSLQVCVSSCVSSIPLKECVTSGQTRLGESFALFETVVNSPWFTKTTIALFLTGKDEFRAKLHDVRLQKFHTSLPAYIAIHYNAFSFSFFIRCL